MARLMRIFAKFSDSRWPPGGQFFPKCLSFLHISPKVLHIEYPFEYDESYGKFMKFLDSKWKVYSTFTKSTDETAAIPLKFDWFSQVDFSGSRRPCRFGMAVSLGGGM